MIQESVCATLGVRNDFEALMAKKGITIKRLAKVLGVTSRVLIDRCRAEGLSVQNSITKLDASNETRVRAWFSSAQAIN
jgi:hypothetical protein